MNFRIGILDDDKSKATGIMTQLYRGFDDTDHEMEKRYSEYTLEPIELEIQESIEDMVSSIVAENIDCLIIDYKLSTYATVSYNGVELAKRINKKFFDFPVFLLTSFENDLYDHEIFNAYQVYDFKRYLEDPKERIEINSKIVEQIQKHAKQIELWKEEVRELRPHQGKSAKIDERILELDSFIERSLDGDNAKTMFEKERAASNWMDDLIDKIDELLGEN